MLVAVASAVGDAAETYDLTNVGTLFAFALVCAGVLVLRVIEPDRHRPFKVPFVWVIAPLGVAACLFIMVGLPYHAWERFGLWLAHRHRALRGLRLQAQQASSDDHRPFVGAGLSSRPSQAGLKSRVRLYAP